MSNYKIQYNPKSVLELDLEVDSNTIDTSYKTALKKAVTTTHLKGFRRGKAPQELVENVVGKERLYEKALNDSIMNEFQSSLHQEYSKNSNRRYIVLDNPTFDVDSKWEAPQPLKVKITCTIYPEVNIEPLKTKLRVAKATPNEVTETEIAETVDKIFEQYKKLKSSQLKGINKSSTDETSMVLEKDDDFAKASGAKDMQNLTQSIKSELEYQAQYESERNFEQTVIEQTLKLVQIETPDILIKEELARVQSSFENQLSRIGTTLDNYLKVESMNLEEKQKEWQKQAIDNTNLTLILNEIRKDMQIIVTEEEVTALSSTSKQTPETIRYFLGQSKALDHLKVLARQNN